MTTFFKLRNFWNSITEKTDMTASHIEQHLANNDINSKVDGTTVKVHTSDMAAAKKHITKLGHGDTHSVVGGLNEGWGADAANARHQAQQDDWEKTLERHKHDEVMTRRLKHLRSWKADAAEAAAKKGYYTGHYGTTHAFPGEKLKEETEDQKKAKDEVDLKLKKWKNQQRAVKALGEAIDKEHPIYKEYQGLMKMPIKDLRDHIKRQHRIIDTSEFRTKEHAASHILHTKHGERRMKAVFGESVEQIDEISKEKLTDYTFKSFAAGNELHKQINTETDPVKRAALKAKLSKRNTGVITAAKRIRGE